MADPTPSTTRRSRGALRTEHSSVDPAVLDSTATADGNGADVFFATDSETLTPSGLSVIAALETKATAAGVTHITVVGHADSRGSAQYNLGLSQRRAQAVADQLRKDGFTATADVIDVSGKGKANLPVATPDQTANAHNRVVELTMDKPAAAVPAPPPPPPSPVSDGDLRPTDAIHPDIAPASRGDGLIHQSGVEARQGAHHVRHGLLHLVGDVIGLPFHIAHEVLKGAAHVAGDGLEVAGGAVEVGVVAPATFATGVTLKGAEQLQGRGRGGLSQLRADQADRVTADVSMQDQVRNAADAPLPGQAGQNGGVTITASDNHAAPAGGDAHSVDITGKADFDRSVQSAIQSNAPRINIMVTPGAMNATQAAQFSTAYTNATKGQGFKGQVAFNDSHPQAGDVTLNVSSAANTAIVSSYASTTQTFRVRGLGM